VRATLLQVVLRHYPLTSVRRWGCTNELVVLDFGDHADRLLILFTPHAKYGQE